MTPYLRFSISPRFLRPLESKAPLLGAALVGRHAPRRVGAKGNGEDFPFGAFHWRATSSPKDCRTKLTASARLRSTLRRITRLEASQYRGS